MLMILISAHLVVAVAAPLLTRALGQRAFWLAALIPALSFGWLLIVGADVLAGHSVIESIPWIPELGVAFDFRLGLLQWVLALIVTGIGALVLVYCRWYFADAPQPRVVAPDGLLRGNDRSGDRRRSGGDLRLLGSHNGPVLPADRHDPTCRTARQP